MKPASMMRLARSIAFDAYLQELWREFLSGEDKNSAFLWSVYVLAVWLKEFHGRTGA